MAVCGALLRLLPPTTTAAAARECTIDGVLSCSAAFAAFAPPPDSTHQVVHGARSPRHPAQIRNRGVQQRGNPGSGCRPSCGREVAPLPCAEQRSYRWCVFATCGTWAVACAVTAAADGCCFQLHQVPNMLETVQVWGGHSLAVSVRGCHARQHGSDMQQSGGGLSE
jgi:hypothetical protein